MAKGTSFSDLWRLLTPTHRSERRRDKLAAWVGPELGEGEQIVAALTVALIYSESFGAGNAANPFRPVAVIVTNRRVLVVKLWPGIHRCRAMSSVDPSDQVKVMAMRGPLSDESPRGEFELDRPGNLGRVPLSVSSGHIEEARSVIAALSSGG